MLETIFYFATAASLRRYEDFKVHETQQARPHQVPASVVVWTVAGKVRGADRREVVAEFGAELPATIFRDMAEIVARS